MPIVDVELVVAPDADAPNQNQTKGLADALGSIFQSDPTGTWVRVRLLPESQYAENNQTSPVFPAFVSIIKAQLPDTDAIATEARKVTEAVASAFDRRAENVHVLYEPKAAGRIAFGGTLRLE